MGKLFFIFVFIILIIGGVFIFLYFFYEKPIQEEANNQRYRNITIRAFDSGKQVSTGFVVLLDDVVPYYYGNTTASDFFFLRISFNRTFSIYNINIKNQTYYTSRYYNSELLTENVLVELPLYANIGLNISYSGVLGQDNPLFLYLIPEGTLQYVVYCVRWSENILDVDFLGVERADPPKRFENKVDRCFYTKQPLTGATVLPLYYKKFGSINSNDYIAIYILDGDLSYSDHTFHVENEKGLDLAQRDYSYNITLTEQGNIYK